MKTLWQDLAYALRILRKSPTFTLIAVITLALGIGANTAIFSYVDAWMIKPLPYPQADRLMVLLSHDKKSGGTNDDVTSTADFVEFQKQNTSFAQTAAWAGWNFNLTGDGRPEFVEGGRVSWNFFDTLGVKPILGRTFLPQEDQSGAPRVAVISEGLWKSRYGGDPNIVGRKITVESESYTVVGVMPGAFQFPLMGVANLWTPFALTDKARADRDSAWFDAFGRLKPGVTQTQAAAECTTFWAQLEKSYPQTNKNRTALLSPMTFEIGKEEGAQQVMICMWVVGLILLIACANVANLMLARASRRSKEFAVRGALGATRGRLVRQIVTESLLLFLFGGVAGTLMGMWMTGWIESQIPGHIRGYIVNYGHVNLDFVTLGFTLGIALICGLIFGLAPAFANSKVDINTVLKDASGQASGSRKGGRLRRAFVAGEVALAVVVLISTTLLVKSFVLSVTASPGYNPSSLMVAQVSLPKTKYTDDAKARNFADDVLARIHALPAVASAGMASAVPFGGFGQIYEVEAVGKPAPNPGEEIGSRWSAVSPDYFSAMQMRLLKGRTFTSVDAPDSARSVVINETLARKFWSNEDPIGHKLTFGPEHTACTIIGIVNDIKMYQLTGRPERQMYVSLVQFPSMTLGFVARAEGNSQALPTEIRDAIWAVDKDQPVSSVEEMATLMDVSNTGNRVLTKLMGFFGVLATFLGAIGIYGLMAHMVTQRTHEIGIRLALGARPGQVMSMIVRQAMTLTTVGVVIGAAGALALTRSLAFMLYSVKPTDPSTFVSVAVGFAIVAMAACYVPARRAMKVSPIVALRYE